MRKLDSLCVMQFEILSDPRLHISEAESGDHSSNKADDHGAERVVNQVGRGTHRYSACDCRVYYDDHVEMLLEKSREKTSGDATSCY